MPQDAANDDVTFIFLDESHQKTTKLFSFTGVFVRAAKLKGVRDDFYAILAPFVEPNPSYLILQPPELRGASLPGATDAEKLDVLRRAVAIVNENGLDVMRVGIHQTGSVPDSLRDEDGAYGLAWFEFTRHLQNRLARGIHVPVMDAVSQKRVRHISQPLRVHQLMRAVGREEVLSIRNADNLVGEVFYADSKYASMVQLADLASYLLNALDLRDGCHQMTAFKQEIVNVADDLEGRLVERHVVTVEHH